MMQNKMNTTKKSGWKLLPWKISQARDLVSRHVTRGGVWRLRIRTKGEDCAKCCGPIGAGLGDNIFKGN